MKVFDLLYLLSPISTHLSLHTYLHPSSLIIAKVAYLSETLNKV